MHPRLAPGAYDATTSHSSAMIVGPSTNRGSADPGTAFSVVASTLLTSYTTVIAGMYSYIDQGATWLNTGNIADAGSTLSIAPR